VFIEVKAGLENIILFPDPFLITILSPEEDIVKLLCPISTLIILFSSVTNTPGEPILKYFPNIHTSLVSSINTKGFRLLGILGNSL
jgi:hypothetical protein